MPLQNLKTSPFKVPFYDATDEELEQWLIFCICVAGKSAAQMEKKVDAFLGLIKAEILPHNPHMSPLSRLSRVSRADIDAWLRRVKMGRYGILAKTLWRTVTQKLLNPDWLREWSADDLMTLPGVGPKTARFFLMYTRRDFRGAILDTHILKWLDENQGTPPLTYIPKSTPQSPKKYAELEDMFLAYCHANKLKPAEFDFKVWSGTATAKMKKFDYYLVQIRETHGDLAFYSKFAVRLASDMKRNRQAKAIENYVACWRDDKSQVTKVNEQTWSGPSGVDVSITGWRDTTEETWKTIVEEDILHTACL